jgi:outer membrane protein, heavy metal efflux system
MMSSSTLIPAAAFALRGPVLALSALFAAPGFGNAQEAVLPTLLIEVDTANPQIVAARSAAESAAARIPQAGALPDPMLGIGFMNVPVTNPGLGFEMMTMTQVQVGAQLPWPGKLSLREDMARFQAEAAEWELERVRDRVRTDVKATYYQAYFVDRALEVTLRNEGLVSDFALLTSAKYGVGTGAQPDVLKAQVERSRLADQIIVLRQERAGLAARLNALLGRPTDTPLPVTRFPEDVRAAATLNPAEELSFISASLADVLSTPAEEGGPLPSIDELQRQAEEHNPMIQAHVQRITAQERAVRLAERAKLPDLSLTAAYSYRSGRGDFFNLMLSAPLPVFAGRKQDQSVLEQTATLAEQEARYEAMVDDVHAEIASLWTDLQRGRDQLALLDEGILPQAQTSLSSATASYQVGQVDFLTLLDSQVTLYRHELDYHRLLADFARNLAALERAVGTEVLR